jgi:transcriptional regulator with XRE-family HTH domain
MICPSILELTTSPLSAAMRQHVAECLRCKALLAAWDADPITDDTELDVPDVEFPRWRPRTDPRSPAAVGAIHTVAVPGYDVFLVGLVVDHDDQQATVMPLSTEAHSAADWDVLLDDNVLGYRVMVEAWNPVDVLSEQLIDQIAVVEQRDLFVELYKRSLAGADAPDGLADGPPIDSEDDPRVLFREHETERVRAYGEPARAIGMGETLGEVLRAAREAQGRTAEELAGTVGLKLVALKRIEEDREDLQASIPLKGFASLLAELELPTSEAFLGYVEEAAFRNDRHAIAEQTSVYARRRKGVRVRPNRRSESERRARAKAWVERLRHALAGSG